MTAPERSSPDFAVVYDAAPIALLVIRADGLVMTTANAAYLTAVGMSAEQVEGRHVFDVFPNSPVREEFDQVTDLRSFMLSVVDERATQIAEAMRYDIPRTDGGFDVRYWNVVEVPILDAAGEVEWILHYTEDVTALIVARTELAETERARDAAARQVASLAEVALALTAAESLRDLETIVLGRGFAVLGADGGGLVTPAEDGRWRVTASKALGETVQVGYAYLDHDSPFPSAYTARTGERVLLPDTEAGQTFHPSMAEVYEQTGRRAWAVLPLVVQGELLGSLAAGWVHEHEFAADEVEIIAGFAAQCAQTLHRIQLADAERLAARQIQELAEALQRSMLTAPPALEGLQVAVRYRPAEDVAQVGGDWYDAFVQPDGTAVVVIGDVAGHDSVAAARMGQLRGLLRALAYNADVIGVDTPARILMRLGPSARGLGVESLATAVVAQIGRASDGRPGRSLLWSNAGNPPPVLLGPDGTTTLLDPKSDLLLGVDDVVRHDHSTRLEPGATLVLYTDGLVERRTASIDHGIADLRAALADLAAAELDELCDRVLERLAPHTGEDDIAMVAVRVAT